MDGMTTAEASGERRLAVPARNVARNFERWVRALLAPPPRPPLRLPRPKLTAVAAAAVLAAAAIASMFVLDTAASDWARHEPGWVRGAFEDITQFGLGGWFLFPSGFVLLYLAAVTSPALPRRVQATLNALAVRFGFVFLAIGVPGLFVSIVKRLIGRARPYVGGQGGVQDDPFLYHPLVWRPDYASMPSGHAANAVAAAIAIGAIWPQSRAVMWLYALLIMVSRIAVLAHHPSDVIAGALTGAVGVYLVRRFFAARRLLFSRDLRAFPGPSWRRITEALHCVVAGRGGKVERGREAL